MSLLLVGCHDQEPPLTRQEVFPVKLITLDEGREGGLLRYPGQVLASERSDLSFRIGGELRELAVKAGDEVQEGDLIARLDERDAQRQLDNARSAFQLASATFERMRVSLDRGAISRAQFDEAKASYLSARAALNSAEDQLSYTVLKAPFSGLVASVPVENFQIVGAQQTIAELQQPGNIDVTFQLPEQQMRHIDKVRAEAMLDDGEDVIWVAFSDDGRRYPAHYREHDSSVSEGSLSYEVTLTLPEPDDVMVLSGMSATVLLDIDALTADGKHQWVVPTAAVMIPDDSPQQAVVWRFIADHPEDANSPGHVEAVKVTPGRITADGMLIEGDLAVGDRLVSAGAQTMLEGREARPWVKEEGL